jgi:hypothetical protein
MNSHGIITARNALDRHPKSYKHTKNLPKKKSQSKILPASNPAVSQNSHDDIPI